MGRWLKRGLGGLASLVLILSLAVLAGRGGAGGDQRMLPESVAVTAHPIPHFHRTDAAARRFGPLEYLGGIELRGAHRAFGGVSALRIAPDGAGFLAVTDTGDWIQGRIEPPDGAPTALRDVAIVPIRVAGGRRAMDIGLWDAESLALHGGEAFVAVERDHAILAFDFARDGLRAEGRRLPLPGFVADWPENRGIEALGVIPEGSPLAGRLIGLSERSGTGDEPTEGFVMRRDGAESFRFRLKRSGGFDVTDLDFLPNGDLVVLERYFSPRRGVAMRLRRLPMTDVAPEATVDGEVLLTAGPDFHVDNMEALSIHRSASGETIVTILSDDNFSIAQRTLLLRFRWLGE